MKLKQPLHNTLNTHMHILVSSRSTLHKLLLFLHTVAGSDRGSAGGKETDKRLHQVGEDGLSSADTVQFIYTKRFCCSSSATESNMAACQMTSEPP